MAFWYFSNFLIQLFKTALVTLHKSVLVLIKKASFYRNISQNCAIPISYPSSVFTVCPHLPRNYHSNKSNMVTLLYSVTKGHSIWTDFSDLNWFAKRFTYFALIFLIYILYLQVKDRINRSIQSENYPSIIEMYCHLNTVKNHPQTVIFVLLGGCGSGSRSGTLKYSL